MTLTTENLTEEDQSVIDDCVSAWVENDFLSRWHKVEAYHGIGKRILESNSKYGDKIVTLVAQSIGKSSRTIYRAVEFAKMYPDLNMLPEGKNVSWYSILKKYLPEKKEQGEIDEPHKLVFSCPNCNHEYQKKDVKFVEKETE